MRRNYKAWPASVIALMILCLGCTVFVLGQSGAGRKAPNANSRKNPPAPQQTVSSRKTRTTRGSTAANDRGKQTNDEPKAGSMVRNQMGIELVYVPAGRFMMGSNNTPPFDEKPVHEVTIKKGFYMGRYEVTQAEWQQVMGNNPSNSKGDNLPVEEVSWDNVQSFIQKLNELGDGFKYRLPTEAEWEYACRAGTTGDYAGDVNEMAWFSENSGSKTHPVGGKRPNAWGLADMHGNVWEWCADYYHTNYNGAPVDGSAWVTGGKMKYRVLRGGGALYDRATDQRSAIRQQLAPDNRRSDFGFRIVALARTK